MRHSTPRIVGFLRTALTVTLLTMDVAACCGQESRVDEKDRFRVWSQNPEATQYIRKVMARDGSCDFQETPLKDCLAYFATRHQIAINLDRLSLQEVNVKDDAPIQLKLRGVTLRTALDRTLRQYKLFWEARENSILVHSRETHPDVETRAYALEERMVHICDGVADVHSLTDFVQSALRPESWNDRGVDGDGSMDNFGKTLVVSQTESVHRRIEWLLQTVAKIEPFGPPPTAVAEKPLYWCNDSSGLFRRKSPPDCNAREKPADVPNGVRVWRFDDEGSPRMRKALAQKVSYEFNGTPLAECLTRIGELGESHINIDHPVLKWSEVDLAMPITVSVRDMTLRESLYLLLEQANLSWCVLDDSLLVTAPGELSDDEALPVRLYEIDNSVCEPNQLGDLDSFIQTMIEVGTRGEGNTYSPIYGNILAIEQTPDIHEKIEWLLQTIKEIGPLRLPSNLAPSKDGGPSEESAPTEKPQ